MKKRILCLLTAICLIAGLLPLATLAVDADKPDIQLAGLSGPIDLTEGCAPLYYKTGVTATSNGDSVAFASNEDDYNIMVTYPQGGKPTITLKGAYINITGFSIALGTQYGANYSVDIIIAEDSTLVYGSGGLSQIIKSDIEGNVTIKSEGDAKLTVKSNFWHGAAGYAAVDVNGNLNLENANVLFLSTRKDNADGETDSYIRSKNGNVTVNGGNLQIASGAAQSSDDNQYPAVTAPNGQIIIEDGANVKIWNQRKQVTFSAGNGIVLGESNIEVALTHAEGTLFATAPTFQSTTYKFKAATNAPSADADQYYGVMITAPTGLVDFDANNQATYKYMSFHVHTPEADDGNCMTAVNCAGCGEVAIPAAQAHTPVGPDDGDCTTPIACANCDKNAVEAKTHRGGRATCVALAVCDNCGTEYGSFGGHTPDPDNTDCNTPRMCIEPGCGQVAAPAGQHIPAADDGNCETPVACSICGQEAIAAKIHDGGTASCIAQAVCTNPGCSMPYGPLGECVPGEDDGNCTTAVLCTVCGQEAVPAKPHTGGEATCRELAKCDDCGRSYGEYADHISNIDDGDCTTPVKCFVCGEETVPADAHTGGKATCKKLAKCENCGAEYGELAAHTPAADDGDCTTAVNCTYCGEVAIAAKAAHTPAEDDGDCTTAIKCTECTKDAVAAKEHTPGDAATCTTAQNCTDCGTELAAALGHDYEAVVTDPDCVNGGYTTYTCSVCGDTYTDDEVDALGHTAGDAATCTTAQKCTVCDAELVAALGHTAGDAATCTTAQKCTVCDAELVAALGHTAGDAATCTTAQKCTVCDAELAAALGHTAGDAATCTTAQKCTVCDVELAAAKGHTPAADDGDCTTAIKCSVCDAETTAAKTHTYTDNADTTCDNEGCTNTRVIENTNPGTNGNPQTGDYETVLLVVLFALLAVGSVSVVVINKKRNAVR